MFGEYPRLLSNFSTPLISLTTFTKVGGILTMFAADGDNVGSSSISLSLYSKKTKFP